MPYTYDHVGLLANIYEFLSQRVNSYRNNPLFRELVEYFEFFRKYRNGEPNLTLGNKEEEDAWDDYQDKIGRFDEIYNIIKEELAAYVDDVYTNDEAHHLLHGVPPVTTRQTVNVIMNSINESGRWISVDDIEEYFYEVYGTLSGYY